MSVNQVVKDLEGIFNDYNNLSTAELYMLIANILPVDLYICTEAYAGALRWMNMRKKELYKHGSISMYAKDKLAYISYTYNDTKIALIYNNWDSIDMLKPLGCTLDFKTKNISIVTYKYNGRNWNEVHKEHILYGDSPRLAIFNCQAHAAIVHCIINLIIDLKKSKIDSKGNSDSITMEG